MATVLDFCRGMSRPVNWYRLILRHVTRHVANTWVCKQAMWARLSDGSFFDFFPFSRRKLRYYVLSALDFGEFKRFDGSIYGNLRELSSFINRGGHLNTTWLWDDNRGNSYIVIVFVDYFQSRQIAQSLSGRNFIVWNRWKSTLKARSVRLLYSSGEILALVARSLFTINDHAKRARDCKC